jgi:proline dehydrogenase
LCNRLTGAGPVVIDAMTKGENPPRRMLEAMTQICNQASRQNTRVWVDAEQQVFQNSIDAWTIDLMRKYNRNGRVLVYNTLQAYLKDTPKNIARHLSLAQKEGWGIGIKLVRGAYILIEERGLIHDTIEDTHVAYNNIVQDLLSKKFLGISESEDFPHLQLFLASHNAHSIERGYQTWKDRTQKGLATIELEIGQLQGMADEVSCGLVQMRQQMGHPSSRVSDTRKSLYPRAFKCLCWGSTRECVQFLIRRVVENRGSLERTKVWLAGLKEELWRRINIAVRLK